MTAAGSERNRLTRAAPRVAVGGEGACAGPAPSVPTRGRKPVAGFRERALGRRVADGGLEYVAAGIAFPEMADAALVDEFRPFRHEQMLAALRAFDYRPAARESCGIARAKFHGASS